VTRKEAASIFAASVEARRLFLSSLYDGALENWREQKLLGQQRTQLFEKDSAGNDVVRPGKAAEEQTVTRQLTLALWSAQDYANALFLIIDYSLDRFKLDAGIGAKGLGASICGTKFSKVVKAMADHAQHLPEFRAKGARPHNRKIFAALNVDFAHNAAPTQFLENLAKGDYGPALTSYRDFETMIINAAGG
jgi:hypothetical protein